MKKRINTIYLYDRGLDLLKCISNKYDVVIDTEQWHGLSVVVAYFTGALVRIGFSTNERKGLFTHTVHYSHDEHEVRSFLNLMYYNRLIKLGKFPFYEGVSGEA